MPELNTFDLHTKPDGELGYVEQRGFLLIIRGFVKIRMKAGLESNEKYRPAS